MPRPSPGEWIMIETEDSYDATLAAPIGEGR